MSGASRTAAQSLQCPNCGAPASPEATRCGYCRARLATISCPSCLGPVFTETAFCPRCGTAVARRQAEGAGKTCPRCRAGMAAVRVGPFDICDCAYCDGVWVDAATFERLCSQRERATLESLAARHAPRAAKRAAKRAAGRGGTIRYRRCPDCGKFMNRVNFAKASGIVLDVCRNHGTFFDPGELRALMDFIGEGGLGRAREAEIEALDQRRREIERLEAARDGRTSSRPTGASADRGVAESAFWKMLAALAQKE